MGVGNFYIDDAETVYIDKDIFIDTQDDELYPFYFEDLTESIRQVLPESYDQENRYFGRDEGRVIAENGFYQIVLTDWEGYIAVSVALKETDYWQGNGICSLASYHLNARARKIFDALSEFYDLRIRCCAWTSGPYVKAA